MQMKHSIWAIVIGFGLISGQTVSAGGLKNPSLAISSISVLTAHKIRVEIPATLDPIPSNCYPYGRLYLKSGPSLSTTVNAFFSVNLKITSPEVVEIDGLDANQVYGIGTSIQMACHYNNSSKSTRTSISPILAKAVTPSEDSAAPMIQAGNIGLLEGDMYPNALALDILSPGTHHAVTSIDGVPCRAGSSNGSSSCVISDASKSYSMGGAINNEDTSYGVFQSAYNLEAGGQRKLRFNVQLGSDLDPKAPHTFKIELFDFLGRSVSREYVIPAQ